jgi:hypothetical protein
MVATGALLCGAACLHLEDPTSASRSQLVVHAVLDTRATLQRVLISRAATGGLDSNGARRTDDEPVVGAEVTIISPTGVSMPATAAATPGEYEIQPNQFGVDVAQGGAFSLHIRTPLGEEVTGTTTVPVAPAMDTVPLHVFFRQRDTLRLAWPAVPGAQSYEVVVQSLDIPEYRKFTDTTIVLPGTALTITGDDVFPYAPVNVMISAVDANYYDYYRAQSDPFAGTPPRGLTGAYGVFGSIAPMLVDQLQVR